MHDLQRLRPVLFADDARNLDFAGGDVLDVDLGVGQGFEHALGDAGVGAHADADDGHLGQFGVEDGQGFAAEFSGEFFDRGFDVVQVAVFDGEGDVGGIVIG